MKDLKEYLKESILDDVFAQIEIDDTDKMMIIKKSITNWVKDNFLIGFKENKLSFDFSATSIIVNYDGDLKFKSAIASLTNGMFQWGEVRGDLECSYCNSLTSLEGAPQKVGGSFDCSGCRSLTSLKGAPQKVGRDFTCSHCNSLTSLEGAPKEVGRDFTCSRCNSLTSLEGAPKEVVRDFICIKCESLTSLEGAPKKVGKDFYCYGCKIAFTEDDVKNISNVKGEIKC